MNSILDRFPVPRQVFRPTTIQEVFALRLAQKLNDGVAAEHYVGLADRYSTSQVLTAYRRTLVSKDGTHLGRRFHTELERVNGYGGNGLHVKLLAIRVERRTVAVAVFQGEQLEYTDVRHLSSARDKAVASTIGFITWMLEQFPIESVAIESLDSSGEILRSVLLEALIALLHQWALPKWTIPKTEIFAAFGFPSLKSRKAVREIACSIWPVLSGTNGKTFIQDAAVLGLHVQIERLFLN
jgi:hypothetical protein